MQQINFKKLLKNYNQNLLKNLRGFGKEDEYLKFWVPGTDNYQSFMNLVDALVESKIYEFQISLEDAFQDDIILRKIENILNKISTLKKKDLNIYEINIDKREYFSFKDKNKNKKNIKIKRDPKLDKTKIAKKLRNNENLTSIYRESLSKFNPKNYFTKKIKHDEKSLKEKFDEINLYFEIENDILVNVYHDKNNNTLEEKFINLFFDIIINKNIQEAADHSVIYLEEKLRVFDNTKVSNGIILPGQGGEYFNILNNIIRNVFSEYKNKNKRNFEINKNYFKISKEWLKLPEEDKLDKINKILDEIKKQNPILKFDSILVNKIENNFKINLDVDKNFSMLQSKKNILLEIEKKLKVLDQTLEVFIEEILDQNKLRLKNSPQKLS